MRKKNEISGSGNTIHSSNTSILTNLTDKPLANPAMLGLSGSIIWFLLMLFFIVNDLLINRVEAYSIFVTADILNITQALFLFLFILFLYKQGIYFHHKKLFFMIMVGFVLRLAGKIVDGFTYFLIDFEAAGETLITGLFIISDLLHFLGAIAIASFMLILFKKEHKTSYKVIGILGFIFGLLYGGTYIFLFLLDAGIIDIVYIQITRSISLISSLVLILYFINLLKDSVKTQKTAGSSLNA
ncbi:hypothetical protein [Bacillus benzoevorans]|uniref:Uncharacterized protein n=1 Tax=Bacillus benzoevorans TaxID=1456 RepID=A0A7X0LTK0_9BACI|nr:hypothetical protein [Bacillus benzoevorans]MBB6443981.1 hypothetical protein [Bacillus benzoevorans]